MLAPLVPLDRPAALAAIDQALARQDERQALQILAANPLAVFSWINVDGVLAWYLKQEAGLLHRYGALAVLLCRWVEQQFRPAGMADELAHCCLQNQVRYLQHVFGRLPDLPQAAREAARRAHRRMTEAALARDQQRWGLSSSGFAAAFEAWREAEDPYFQSQVAADWAAVLEQQGELEAALDRLEFAVQVASQTGDLERLGRRRLHKGKLSLLLGLAEPALHEYREAGGVYRVTREHDQFVLALVAEAEVLRLIERTEEAQAALQAAQLAARELGDEELLTFVEQAGDR